MGLYSGGLIIGRIFTSDIWGAYFREGLFCGGLLSEFYSISLGLIIGILRYFVFWIAAYPVDNGIHPLNNWGLEWSSLLRDLNAQIAC